MSYSRTTALTLATSATLAVIACFVAMDARAGGPDVSASEFSLYMDWRDGREDPRLAKLSDAAKLKKVARSLGASVGDLKAAIAKVEPVAETVGTDTEKSISAALATTPLKGRVQMVKVDAGGAHAVALIKWSCGDKRDVDKEASWVGWATADSGKIISTLALWCVNEVDTKLFSAKAATMSLGRISRDKIDRFAPTRYIRLFEGIKRGPHE